MDYAAYRAELDDILLNGTPMNLLKFMQGHAMKADLCLAEMTLHKARTAAKTLPLDSRKASKAWLQQHGYHALDDDEL